MMKHAYLTSDQYICGLGTNPAYTVCYETNAETEYETIKQLQPGL